MLLWLVPLLLIFFHHINGGQMYPQLLGKCTDEDSVVRRPQENRAFCMLVDRDLIPLLTLNKSFEHLCKFKRI